MSTTGQLIIILSALGSINGFILALYLWRQNSNKTSNRFLALMLVMFSIRTLKSVLFYFNPEITKTILQVGLSACFLIGPLLYLFCLSKLDMLKSQTIRWEYHLTVLVGMVFIVGLIFPYQAYEELWGDFFYRLINYVWLAYILLSTKVILPRIITVSKRAKFTQDEILLFTVFTGNVFIWFAYFTASYTSYIVGALSFSFIILIACLLIVFNLNNKETQNKYANKEIDAEKADEMIKQLYLLMENEELYKNSLITMPQTAKRLGMTTSTLSQLLNANLGKSFPVFINELRIGAAKKMLMLTPAKSMEKISEECGFNAQSTFYSAFKKVTSLTPANFKSKNTPNL